MIANKDKIMIAMARECINTNDLSKKAKMPLPTINNVIAGRSVRPATLGKICKVLNCDVTDLL